MLRDKVNYMTNEANSSWAITSTSFSLKNFQEDKKVEFSKLQVTLKREN